MFQNIDRVVSSTGAFTPSCHVWYSALKVVSCADTLQVAHIQAGVEDERYEALCYRHSAAGQCAPYGVLSFWGGDEALYRISVADTQRWEIKVGKF